MHRESLQNNVERIRMSKRLATIATDVPIEFSIEAVKAQAADDPAAQGHLQGDGVPLACSRNSAPARTRAQRDYRVIGGRRGAARWLAQARAQPHAVAISKSAEGEFALDTIGLARTPGEARAVTTENLAVPEAVARRRRRRRRSRAT